MPLRWPREVDEYRPYETSDTEFGALYEELSKYGIDDETFNKIVSVLELGPRWSWGIVASRLAGALLRTGRVLLILVMVSSVVGTWRHALANFVAGQLHRDFATTWQTMSGWSQGWDALTKQVGPAAPLTPLALALVAVLFVLAAALDAPSTQP